MVILVTKPLIEPEETLIQLMIKPFWSKQDVAAIEQLVSSFLDWSRVIGILQVHRISGICWMNLMRNVELLNRKCSFNKFYDYLRNVYHIQQSKAVEQIRSTQVICKALKSEKINFAIMKGPALAISVYENLGSRDFVDNDVLVHPSDIKNASEILTALGYVQGKVDMISDSIIPATREEKLRWSMYSHEVHPFLKKVEHPFLKYHIVDLHYSIDLNTKNRTDDMVKQLIDRSVTYNTFPDIHCLSGVDMLIFICNHFYKEAISYDEIMNYRDLLLYKICDIAYLLHNKDFTWEEVVDRSIESGCQEGVYYGLFYTNEIFDQLIPPEYLHMLEPQDTSFLNKVYQYDSDLQMIEWEDPIVQRIFKMNRAAEVNFILEG